MKPRKKECNDGSAFTEYWCTDCGAYITDTTIARSDRPTHCKKCNAEIEYDTRIIVGVVGQGRAGLEKKIQEVISEIAARHQLAREIKSLDEIKAGLNKYRNAWYNDIDKEHVEVANLINDLFQRMSLEKIKLVKESWLIFTEVPDQKKITKTFYVISKYDNSLLGVIKWHPPYRKYSFFVTSKFEFSGGEYLVDTKIFDDGCLDEVSDFLKKLMDERKKEKANAV